MSTSVVSERYAEALFDLAKEKDIIEKVREELSLITETIKEQPDFNNLLTHPVVNDEDKKTMLQKIFGGKVSETTLNFISLLIDKSREGYLTEIYEAYNNFVNNLHKRVIAEVYTALDVEAKTLDMLRERLETYLDKKVEIESHVDASILGGVLVKVGDRVIDGTLKTRFANMVNSLN